MEPQLPASIGIKEMLNRTRGQQPVEKPVEKPAEEVVVEPEVKPAAEVKPDAQVDKDEKLKKASEALREKLFGRRKPAQEPEEKPAAEVKPEVEKVENKPAPAKKVKVAQTKTTEELLREELELLKRKIEEGEAKRAAAPQAPNPEVKPVINDSVMSLMNEDERYEFEVFGEMERRNPSKYKGAQEKFAKSIEAAAEYKAKWEKENPGSQFNPDDSDHDDFFSKNTVKYDKIDFRKSEVSIASRDIPEVKEARTELDKMKAESAVKELAPKIMQASANSIKSMLTAVDPEIAEFVEKNGGEKLVEEFPAKGQKSLQAASAVHDFSESAYRLLETDGLVSPDQNNPVHGFIIQIITKQEPAIKAQPLSAQKDDEGRMFATWQEWAGMSDAQRQKHWHLGAPEIIDIFTQIQSERLKHEFSIIDKEFEAFSRRRGINIEQAKPQAPKPVSIASRPVVETPGARKPTPSEDFGQKIRKTLFAR